MSKSNVDLVQYLYGAFGKGDIPTLMNSMSADIAWHSGGRASDYPGFGAAQGPRRGTGVLQDHRREQTNSLISRRANSMPPTTRCSCSAIMN